MYSLTLFDTLKITCLRLLEEQQKRDNFLANATLYSYTCFVDLHSRKPSASMIRWVLTVPAIWKDKSKQFMREVACRV